MRRPRIRLRTLMILVAVAAVLAWLARSRDGRTTLILAGLLVTGLAVGTGLSVGFDRIVERPPRQGRRD